MTEAAAFGVRNWRGGVVPSVWVDGKTGTATKI